MYGWDVYFQGYFKVFENTTSLLKFRANLFYPTATQWSKSANYFDDFDNFDDFDKFNDFDDTYDFYDNDDFGPISLVNCNFLNCSYRSTTLNYYFSKLSVKYFP